MSDTARWVIVVLVLMLLLGLVLYARGDAQHRGDEVGALQAVGAAAALWDERRA